jgi:hypothetical protein
MVSLQVGRECTCRSAHKPSLTQHGAFSRRGQADGLLEGRVKHPVMLTLSSLQIHVTVKYPLRTSHETHYVSATEPNRLMLFGETVAVYCENHTEERVRETEIR